MVEAGDRDQIISKRMAICALLPFAIVLEQGGQQGTVNAITRAARASASYWFMNPIRSYVVTLFQKPSSPCLNRPIVLVSPHVGLWIIAHGQDAVIRWAAAASAIPATEEVSQSVVDTLLQIVRFDHLQPHIPIETWAWIKNQLPLPPVCLERRSATNRHIVHYVRGLGDFEILKSYFLLIWSEWDCLFDDGLYEMESSIKEEFGGIGMWRHREDLTKRLDHVLRQLDRGTDYLAQHNPELDDESIQKAKGQYRKLERVLADVERETMYTLTRTFLS